MRIVIVGPTYPSKGGISQHTTLVAHELAARGDDVTLCSWASQYPKRLYPGEAHVPDGRPEVELFPATTRRLRWWWPIGWVAEGWRHRRAEAAVLVIVSTIQIPAYLGFMAGLGRWRRAKTARGPRVIALCHNVIPHEPRRFDRKLLEWMLRRVDGVLTHTPALVDEAHSFTDAPARCVPLPPHSAGVLQRDGAEPVRNRPARNLVVFFGVVRPYKGVDVLVRALAQAPGVAAVIAGEFWSGLDETRALAAELGVADRVEIIPGYVSNADISELLARADAMVLPYRSGTASWNVQLAHEHGLPVVASRVGSFPLDVREGVDGLLFDSDDPAALAAALRHLYEPGVLGALRAGISVPDQLAAWTGYVEALHELAG